MPYRSNGGSNTVRYSNRKSPVVKQKDRYELITDLNKIHHLRLLRNLTLAFNRYHMEDVQIPTAQMLAMGGYKAIVCTEIDDTGERWTVGFMFRIGREKKAIWHTVVSVDYVLLDPQSNTTFSKMATCIRLLSQFVLKRSKARVVDLVVNTDTQMNPVMANRINDVLYNEGLTTAERGGPLYAKRIRSVDRSTGRDSASLPLPNVNPSDVRGMRPLVQSTIKPQKAATGDTVRFIGRIKKSSKQYQAILNFCTARSDWIDPPMTERLTYMQSLFTGRPGDIRRYVDSIVEDAHFIVALDAKGRLSAFMAFIVGYSVPALGGANGAYVSPENTVFVPLLLCKSSNHGRGRWTKIGFQQALSLYKMLFTLLAQPDLVVPIDLVGVMTTDSGLHPHLLEAIGFDRAAEYSNAPAHACNTEFYSRPI